MSRQVMLLPARSVIYPRAFRVPIASRKLATPPSSQGQSGANKEPPDQPQGSNTLIILSALGALGGLYYYYTRGQPAVDRENARRKEEEVERKVREIGEAGKYKAENAARQGHRDYEAAKAAVHEDAAATRTRAAEASADLTERAHQSAQEAQAKFDEYKNAAERKISDVHDLSEIKIEESKDAVARQAHEAKNKSRTWFGWGSSK